MRHVTDQIVAIMFSDIAEYSKIENDELYSKFDDCFARFVAANVEGKGFLYHNTWGDALVLVSATAALLLDVGMQLIAYIDNTNWRAMGFPFELKARVGLHLEQVKLISQDGKVEGVTGEHVNTTARIEPVVEPGRIYCSEHFYMQVKGKTKHEFRHLGKMSLAKSYGTLDLYEVITGKGHSTVVRAEHNRSSAKIRKEFSDHEIDEYLSRSFRTLVNSFSSFSADLERQDSDVIVRTESPSDHMFCMTVYVQGQKRAGAKLWMGSGFNYGIHYSNNPDPKDTSMNENVYPDSNGYDLRLKPVGFLMFGQKADRFNVEELADYLWEAVVRQLQ